MAPRGDFTHEQKAAVVRLYLEKPGTMDEFREGLLENHPELGLPSTPSQMSVLNWKKDPRYATGVYVEGEGSPRSSRTTQNTISTKATSKTGANLLAEFEAQYKSQKDQALLAFLEDAVKGLEAQLSAAKLQLRNHKESMGLIQPSVED
ncbi:hypothetical protein [Pseudomonas kurunegalensis]|uniref:hypothetical protein n=1 Tax=Pseudomonas kurunegalensis TaxID=485880 RepID=UPI004024CDF6